MNLTCSYCQTPFTLGMAEKVAALQRMHAENLNHYDARCPRCGRANAVSRERLEMFERAPVLDDRREPHLVSEQALLGMVLDVLLHQTVPESWTQVFAQFDGGHVNLHLQFLLVFCNQRP